MHDTASKFRRILASAVLLLAAAATRATTPAVVPAAVPALVPSAEARLEPLERIETVARAFAVGRLPAPGEGQRLVVGPLDGRLQLPRCESEPLTHAGPGALQRDRVLVEVGCGSPARWRVFVPVRLSGVGHAVALSRPMMTGERVGAGDVVMVEDEATHFPLGYFTATGQVIGASLRRAVAAGTVLSNQLLQSPDAIVRGQAVTLIARSDGVSVRMGGRALADAGINQRIRVRNESSGRILEGVARSQQVVEINP